MVSLFFVPKCRLSTCRSVDFYATASNYQLVARLLAFFRILASTVWWVETSPPESGSLWLSVTSHLSVSRCHFFVREDSIVPVVFPNAQFLVFEQVVERYLALDYSAVLALLHPIRRYHGRLKRFLAVRQHPEGLELVAQIHVVVFVDRVFVY